MTLPREYNPVEFEVSTWRSGYEVEVTFALDEHERDFLALAAANETLPYQGIDDVLRHSVSRHIQFLTRVTTISTNSSYLVSTLNSLKQAHEGLQERNFCIVLDIVFELVFHHFLYRNHELASLLIEVLRCRVRRMRSAHWKKVYLKEINGISQIVNGYCPSSKRPPVSLAPSTFRVGTDPDNEEG